MPLWLSESDVRAALPLPDLIPAMEAALAAFSAGGIDQPVRTVIGVRERSFFALMPAFHREQSILGAKLVTIFPGNSERRLPTHLAAISLFDTETGELMAVMDGRYITEVRTAAVSAVSVRYLARPDAKVLAILGSGVQARSHLEMLSMVNQFAEARAWSPTPEHLARFARECPIRAAASAEEAVRGADVVVLATDMVTPAIESAWVDDGAHVISIGACRRSHRELDPALIARGRLVVDSREAALLESGDIVQGIAEAYFAASHVGPELGDIVAGRAPGRADARQVTVFKSLGLAIEDVAAAALAYRRARETGRGTEVRL
jgi:ornithine cyclodeaminase/alanine dehydrogenase-like protein (mu-crystallin family)